ncbi:MAG: extracellular solute-binding protein [Pseudomonadota bacterium]
MHSYMSYLLWAIALIAVLVIVALLFNRESIIRAQGQPPIGDRLSVNWYHGAENLQPVIDVFTEQTGISVEVIDSYDLYNSDVVLISDFGTLLHAKRNGYLSYLRNAVRDRVVPAEYRDRDGMWYGVVLRARGVVYAPDRVNGQHLQGWEDLAHERWRGRLALRQSDNVYNRSMVAMMVKTWGPERTSRWIRGIVDNATDGIDHRYLGDTSNVVRIAEGEADLAFVNTYYLGYMLHAGFKSESPDAGRKVQVRWFNDDFGTPMNVTGVGINPGTEFRWEAEKLVDFLLSEQGQRLLSEHTYKYPVRSDVEPSSWLQQFGEFPRHEIDLNDLEPYYGQAIRLMEANGWRRISDDKWPVAEAQSRQRKRPVNPVLYPEPK